MALILKLKFNYLSKCKVTGLEIATNTVAFATKISGEVATSTCFHLCSFETKGLAVATLLLFLLK